MKWSEEEVKILKKYGSNLSGKELQKMLPNRSIKAIEAKCSKLKILKYNKLNQKLTIKNLDSQCFQVLISSILGDGSIAMSQKNSHHYIYKTMHCVNQKNYLIWKRQALSIFKPKIFFRKRKGGKRQNQYVCQTPQHPIFDDFKKSFYGNNKYQWIIPIKYISYMNLLGLLIWYLDDGCNGSKSMATISVKRLVEHDLFNLKKAIDILNKNLNLSLYLRKNNIT